MTTKWLKPGILALIMASSATANAQFNTIRKLPSIGYEILTKSDERLIQVENQALDTIKNKIIRIDSIVDQTNEINPVTYKKETVRKKHLGSERSELASEPIFERRSLPKLTIQNLLAEIRKNGILHEKIVLAQAILETGWFTSSVCRNKNNLFGLTNPRTGQYYEFNHWTESVKAYYTKVQYKYKDKDENYLMWLDKIGYAEDPRYVSSLIKILRQYML